MGPEKNSCLSLCLFGSLSQTLRTLKAFLPATQSAYEHTWVGSWARWHLCRRKKTKKKEEKKKEEEKKKKKKKEIVVVQNSASSCKPATQ